MRHGRIFYVSVYLITSDHIENVQVNVDDLEDSTRDMEGGLIVGGSVTPKLSSGGKLGRIEEEDESWAWCLD